MRAEPCFAHPEAAAVAELICAERRALNTYRLCLYREARSARADAEASLSLAARHELTRWRAWMSGAPDPDGDTPTAPAAARAA